VANLTLTIDDDVLTRARIRALEEGTSVNAVVNEYLLRYADDEARRLAMKEFLSIVSEAGASSGPEGRRWTRDELHDR
jgi:plasmid stability protein